MNLTALSAVANTVRSLSIDAVEKAKSGHPGLPMGCAELGALLYGELLSHWPQDPQWINRDRFVLSAGHGCMLLYSLLHLSGYDLSLDDIRGFRSLGSRTPAIPNGDRPLAWRPRPVRWDRDFQTRSAWPSRNASLPRSSIRSSRTVIDHYTYVLASDGDMMEGVASEAASIAGHLKLGKLIVFYDSNQITIEGSTTLAFSEDVLKRYEGYGWRTLHGDMYDMPATAEMVAQAKKAGERPTIIRLQSIIGKGAPKKAGTAKAHGEALGPEEAAAAKKAIGVPDGCQFYVFPEAEAYFKARQPAWKSRYEEWKKTFEAWRKENPDKAKEWTRYFEDGKADLSAVTLPSFKIGDSLATRAAGGQVLNAIAQAVPNLIGGSADLAPSNSTNLKDMGDFSASNPLGRNFHFGIREHGMGGICNGIAYHGGLRPFCATFLVFSDYMRPSVRLAAIAKLPVIYVFTHDSVFVGEDGPTHEPVEHLAALRAIPNLFVLRPGDAEETELAWRIAYERHDGPTALALTRQGITVYPKADGAWRTTIRKGAYVAKDCDGAPDVVIIATGSEVSVAIAAAAELTDRKVRVVSMLSRELFLKQPADFRHALVPPAVRKVTFEAGVSFGWKGPFDDDSVVTVSIDRFGESGQYQKIAEHLGITAAALVKRIREL